MGFGGKSLDLWLRDSFFTQHLQPVSQLPYLSGIFGMGSKMVSLPSSIIIYLMPASLDRPDLHLSWLYGLRRRRAERDAGISGADGTGLVAAINLQKKLEAIREGEPPYDI